MAFNSEKCLKFKALENGCTISLAPSQVDGSHYSFSTNGANWVNDQITLNNGEYAYVMGHNYPSNGVSAVSKFDITGECEIVSGNVMSLVDEGAGEQTHIDQEYGFSRLFYNAKLKSIPDNFLPAAVLANCCYRYMFYKCEFEEIPVNLLPATELAEYCYSQMFANCTSLTAIPAELLPVTELATGCYDNMFANCKSLTTIPAGLLPVTGLAKRCYASMFAGCESLTEIPAGLLPATELAEACYASMFYNCASLTTIPAGLLPATTLANQCYEQMFGNCRSLTTIPANLLPATELVEACYGYMFDSCSSLTTIPVGLLPATTLVDNCYYNMFNNCQNLTTVPKGAFKAKTFSGNGSCDSMFINCSALNEIHVDFIEWPTEDSYNLSGWVDGVAESGDFYCHPDLQEERGGDYIPYDWTINREINLDKCLKFKALEDNCLISLAPSEVDGKHYYFSTDGITWYANEITLNNGEYAYVRGNSYPSKGFTENHSFDATKEYEIVSGNIMSLVDGGAGEQTSIDQEYGFYGLFALTKLKSIPADLLPATGLIKDCYAMMFMNCLELTEIPAGLLPATDLAEYCYGSMFFSCESLTEIPAGLLPATELAKGCYTGMFANCTSLTTIPANLLPVTELTEYCYNSMFKGCTSLTEIPVGLLPATELAHECYRDMFSNCTNLTTVPKGALMAKQLADYCCMDMFNGCSALNEIHVDFTTWLTADDPLSDWVADVAATGDFYCYPDLPEERGNDRIPYGWTIHRYGDNKLRGSLNFGKLRASIG